MTNNTSDLGLSSYQEYRKQGKKKIKPAMKFVIKITKIGIVTWVIFLIIWSIAAHFNTPDYLPNAVVTVKGAKQIVLNGVLIQDILVSLKRILKGWGLGILVSVPLGLLIGRFTPVSWIFEPFVNFFRFIPAIGFITLFLMWFGVDELSKTVLIFYATIFPILVNTIAAVHAIDYSLIEAAETMSASQVRVFFTVIVPSSVPGIFTGIRLGLGTAITSIVAAEMLAASEGVGYLIYTSRLYYRTDWIFVGIIVLGLMGFLADRILLAVGSKYLKRFGVTR